MNGFSNIMYVVDDQNVGNFINITTGKFAIDQDFYGIVGDAGNWKDDGVAIVQTKINGGGYKFIDFTKGEFMYNNASFEQARKRVGEDVPPDYFVGEVLYDGVWVNVDDHTTLEDIKNDAYMIQLKELEKLKAKLAKLDLQETPKKTKKKLVFEITEGAIIDSVDIVDNKVIVTLW